MSESNNNFEDLKRLLKLKQHEIPPPGYFNNFSDGVIARIREGETGGASGANWLTSLLRVFEVRPGVIGAFATSLCLMLLIGVVLADRSEPGSASPGMAAAGSAADATVTPTLASTAALLPAAENSGIAVSTNPVTSLQPVVTLLGGQSQNPLFQTTGFLTPGQ
jgi:hypothetical protein